VIGADRPLALDEGRRDSLLTGTDEHSVNIATGRRRSRSPRDFVDEKVALFRAEDALSISPDRFIGRPTRIMSGPLTRWLAGPCEWRHLHRDVRGLVLP
jgi:hypothetical protein